MWLTEQTIMDMYPDSSEFYWVIAPKMALYDVYGLCFIYCHKRYFSAVKACYITCITDRNK